MDQGRDRPCAWTREDYRALDRRLLSRGSRLKPAVWRVEGPAGPLVVFDCAGLPRASRRLARWLLRRERLALQRLDGVEGVPQVAARIDRDAFAISWLAGTPLDRATFQRDPQGLARQLRAILAAIHARRVYHLDLRQRQNLLVDPAGRLACVDFGASLALGSFGDAILGRLLAWVDRQAALKYLARYAPEELSLEEARAVLRGLRWRRLWIFSPYRERGEGEGARRRLGRG
ncbi:MAG: hypothetical protein ISR76_00070 [Planctomycetes bacterium]|nr:hypothetical protein [Planctomycetota bacterium]